jgi:hypothetical protein
MNKKIVLLAKISEIIDNKRETLLLKLPIVKEINDGVTNFCFYSDCKNCTLNGITCNLLENYINDNEKIYLFYLPKGTYFKSNNVKRLSCLLGTVQITNNHKVSTFTMNEKHNFNGGNVDGKVIRNSLILASI